MSIPARYVHTNLIARDWQRLAAFYQELFGCTFAPPERDYQGKTLDAATGLTGAYLRGVHLRLPGYGDGGPTLEIFNYAELADSLPAAPNRPGYGHIAFEVDDVAAAREQVLAAGGQPVGEVITSQTAAGTRVTWCYVTDPEGNIIELQAWRA